MITFDGSSHEPCHITITKTDIIDKYNFKIIIDNYLIL